jgi:hypothetical protein
VARLAHDDELADAVHGGLGDAGGANRPKNALNRYKLNPEPRGVSVPTGAEQPLNAHWAVTNSRPPKVRASVIQERSAGMQERSAGMAIIG